MTSGTSYMCESILLDFTAKMFHCSGLEQRIQALQSLDEVAKLIETR